MLPRSVFFVNVCLCLLLFLLIERSSVLSQTKKPNKQPINSEKVKPELPEAKKPDLPEAAKPAVLSKFEQAVADEINAVRADPPAFAGYLEERKKYYRGKLLSLPKAVPIETTEGLIAVDDAINDLKKAAPQSAFQISEELSSAAKDHLQDMIANSFSGHKGSDNSMPAARAGKYINLDSVRISENITYYADTAREIVLLMLVDDGNKNRGHRKNILSAELKFIGLSYGKNKSSESLCVIKFATAAEKKTP